MTSALWTVIKKILAMGSVWAASHGDILNSLASKSLKLISEYPLGAELLFFSKMGGS